jgi:hypothetical protein
MLKPAGRNKLFVLVVAVGWCGLLTASAAACDHGKTVQDARMGILNKLSSQRAKGHSGQVTKGDQSESASQDTPNPLSTITGLWDVKDYYQGQLIDEYFDTWNSDGNEFFIDATDPIEGNVCQGTWLQIAPPSAIQPARSRTYKLKHVAWGFDKQGDLQYLALFHDTITLSTDGKSFTGTEDVYIYDLDGHLVNEYLGDVLHARRITVDF